MLKTLNEKINVNESLLALIDNKTLLLKEAINKKIAKKSDVESYWYWLGVRCGVKSALDDLRKLRDLVEQDFSSIDHCLDRLRGL